MIQALAQKTGGSIRKVCGVLGEARSSFYDASTPTATQVADAAMGDLIEAVFRRHRRRYGYRRLAQELSDRGVTCAPARIRRIMAQRALRAIQPKTFIPKTSDGRADKPSPNLIAGQPLPKALDRAWAGDITFIPTGAGWLYLAVVIDLCSRQNPPHHGPASPARHPTQDLHPKNQRRQSRQTFSKSNLRTAPA